MKDQQKPESETNLTPAQETLQQLWEDHVRHEFNTSNHEETLATMVEDAYVNHIPVLTVAAGKKELREFYAKRIIPPLPPDLVMTSPLPTVGTHDVRHEI